MPDVLPTTQLQAGFFRRSAMALFDGKEWYCKVTHYENGRVVTRRVYSIVVQAVDGRSYTLTGQKLPDSLAIFTGVSHSGNHMLEVLMNPKPLNTRWDFISEWPCGRDILHVFAGVGISIFAILAIHGFCFIFNR
jgi:hypothetical protein